MEEVNIGGIRYVSSKRASEMSDYSQDYIGQLARSGAIDAKRLSGLWYISFESLQAHKTKAESYVPQPPQKKTHSQTHKPADTSISFDGRSYISSARAAKITGYNPDYITQLAREGKILSKQVGNRWYIDQEGIVAHKKEKDALLAAVQVESVGLKKTRVDGPVEKRFETDSLSPITYFKEEEKDLMPKIGNSSQNIDNPLFHNSNIGVADVVDSTQEKEKEEESASIEQRVPIRVVQTPLRAKSRAHVPAIASRKAPQKSSKGFAWTPFAGVATVAVVLIAYAGVAPGYSSLTFDTDTQYANVSFIIDRVAVFLEEILTEEISFSR